MVEFIHLINDISTSVKLGWAGVLVWGVVQFMWYQRGRALPGDIDIDTVSEGWSIGRLLALVRRSPEDADAVPSTRSPMSIAPSIDLPIQQAAEPEPDLGAAAGTALENLFEDDEPLDDLSDRRRSSGGRHAGSNSVPTRVVGFALESSKTT
jgi:hypothetical protein